MNEKHANDLLSAYFDGELAPDERAEAERLLAESEDARRELDETARLSEILQSLPRHSAPDELAPSVMQRIERETLLPAGTDENENGGGVSSRRGWLTALGSVAVTAAAVLLMVNMLHQRPAPDRQAAMTGSEPTGEEAASSASSAERDSVAASRKVAPAADEARQAASETAPQLMRTRTNERSAGRAAPSSSPPAEEVREAESADSRNQSLAEGIDLTEARPGDIVPYFERHGDDVAVVEVTVVDVRQALDTMQLLLKKNDIPPAAADRKRKNGRTMHRNGRPGLLTESLKDTARKERLFAVYVEASEAQMTAALGEMQRKKTFRGLRLQKPVAQNRLASAGRTDRAGQRALDAVKPGEAAENKQSPAAGGMSKTPQAPAIARLPGATESPGKQQRAKRDAGKPAESVAEADRDEPESQVELWIGDATASSFQLQFDLPARTLRESGEKTARTEADGKPGDSSLPQAASNRWRYSGDNTGAGVGGGLTSLQRAPVKVLFVLQPEAKPPTGKPRPGKSGC